MNVTSAPAFTALRAAMDTSFLLNESLRRLPARFDRLVAHCRQRAYCEAGGQDDHGQSQQRQGSADGRAKLRRKAARTVRLIDFWAKCLGSQAVD
jgi:hypothetical protein